MRRSKGRHDGKNKKRKQYMVTALPDGTCKYVEIPKKRKKDAQKYLNAHELLPDFADIREYMPLVSEAITVVRNSESTQGELLQAIVLLGHTPCDEAYIALAEHSSSHRPFAGVAEVALSECLSLAETVLAN